MRALRVTSLSSVPHWFRSTSPSVLLLWLLFGTAPLAAPQGSEPSQPKPNVLLITIDTLRADHLGSYGYKSVRTPVLDGLAREGVRFERAFTPVPLTLPAHCTLMTGTYPSAHGVRDNTGFVLSPEQTTLAEILRGAGYQTAAFVGAFVLDSKFGLGQGFDHYYDNFDLTQYENVSPGYVQRTGDVVAGQTIRWLEQRKGQRRPFFVWTHLYDPHDPYTPPERFRSRHPQNPYDGEIEYTDANVGEIVGWLRRNRLYDDTLIIVLGDHGESLGEHGEGKHGFFIYNATLHIPFIIRFPRGLHAGSTVSEPVGLIDVYPTILQILGTAREQSLKLQGTGLLSLILGKPGNYRAELYAECFYPRLQFGWSDLRALITDRYKYILAPNPELYDLKEDFGEKVNLASAQSVVANQLRESLRALRRRYSASSGRSSGTSRLDAETAENLRSLGYISYSLGDTGSEENPNLRDPKDEIGTYDEILTLFEKSSQREYRAVIPRYEQILKQQPGLKIVQYKLAQAYFQTGSYEAALAAYRRAIELGGDVALATFDLALTYLKLGRPADAMIGFRRTVELDPTHFRARTNLGLLLKNQGKYQEAIEQLEAAVAQAPRALIALNNLGIAYSMAGRHSDAEAAMRRAVEIAPNDGPVRANLATVLMRMGKTDEAQKEMELARKLNPRKGSPP